MKTVLTLSPHLDDAAFSAGPLLAQLADRVRLVVATVFTKSVTDPQGFALACQLDKGLTGSVDYMELRRGEDIAWSRKIGAEAVHGPFAEAPHRGYQSAPELFGQILAGDEIGAELCDWLRSLTDVVKPDVMLVPLGIGDHVDHQWTRRIAEASNRGQFTLVYFKDQPYAANSTSETLACDHSEADSLSELRVALSEEALSSALFAAESYQSQIEFQFGGVDQMRRTLSSAWKQTLPLFHRSEVSESVGFLTEPILI